MSHTYEAAAVTSGAPLLNTPFFEIRNAATRPIYITEIGVSLGAATATNVALARATTQGTGGAGVLLGQAGDPRAAAATASVAANAFTLAPAFTAASMLRRFHLPAAIGAGLIWAWPESEPLVLAVSTSMVLFTPTIAGAAAISSYAKWTE